jgi:nucleotide-binding universal stress UspA family protein
VAEENQAELILLHVIEGLPDAGAATRVGVPVGEGERLRVDLESFARDRLRTAVPAAAREAGCSVREEVAQGKPAREILRVAGERSVDLIVLGAHSRGPLVRAFFGSTSEEVVRASGCPVLMVRETRRARRQPPLGAAGKAGVGVPRA